MIRKFLVSLAVAALAAEIALPSAAGAATLERKGWWSRGASATLPLGAVAPPNAPKGGLYVSGAPDGPTAIAAVRFKLDQGEGQPVLSLKVAPGSEVAGESGVVIACPATTAWQAAEAGAFAAAPKFDCGTSAAGVRAADGTTYTFELTTLVKGGAIDVVLLPGKSALPVPVSPTFSVGFEAPTAASITQNTKITGDAPPPTDPGVPPVTDTAPAGSTASSGSGSTSFGGSAAGGSSGVSPLPSAGADVEVSPPGLPTPAATGAPAGTEAPAADSGPVPVAASPVGRTEGGAPDGAAKILAIAVIIAAAVVAAYAYVRRSAASTALATGGAAVRGAAATIASGGLARFARPRTGSPPPLL